MSSDPTRCQLPSVWGGRRSLLLIPMFFLSVVGCGGSEEISPARAPIMGTVTLNGEMLKQGVIRFIPTDGTTGPQTTAVIDSGVFMLSAKQGPIVGKHRVEIKSTDTGDLAMDDEQALAKLLATKRKPRIRVVHVPPVDNERSHLTAEIPKDGTSNLNFELVSRLK